MIAEKLYSKYTVLMYAGCGLPVCAIVWNISFDIVPLGLTVGTIALNTWLHVKAKVVPQPHAIMFRALWCGAISLAAWWAMDHIHG
jgi:hypothetical protein